MITFLSQPDSALLAKALEEQGVEYEETYFTHVSCYTGRTAGIPNKRRDSVIPRYEAEERSRRFDDGGEIYEPDRELFRLVKMLGPAFSVEETVAALGELGCDVGYHHFRNISGTRTWAYQARLMADTPLLHTSSTNSEAEALGKLVRSVCGAL